MPPRTLKPVDGGDRLLVRDTAPSMAAALAVAAELLELCPEGAYPWRLEAQKRLEGAAVTVTVTFQVAGRARVRPDTKRRA